MLTNNIGYILNSGTLCGINIYPDHSLVDWHSEWTCRPASKKKRIREKWRKRYTRRWSTPKPDVFKMTSPFDGEVFFVCHPDILGKLKESIEALK